MKKPGCLLSLFREKQWTVKGLSSPAVQGQMVIYLRAEGLCHLQIRMKGGCLNGTVLV
jgi:hypothetical protein